MIKGFLILFRYYAFWLLFFFLERLLFVLWFTDKLNRLSISAILNSFLTGLWMDASMAAYVSILPLMFALICWYFPSLKIGQKPLRAYTLCLISAFSTIAVFNANIYREWGSKINYKALDYAFTAPNEALASSASSPILKSLVVLIALIAVSVWLSRKMISHTRLPKAHIGIKFLATILLSGIMVLALRGGWQLSPMNESMAYYSDKPILNHAAINTEWSLMRDILNNKSNKNPYLYLGSAQAKVVADSLFNQQDSLSSRAILNQPKPNVVLIIMESFTADLVESLEGEKNVAPQMEKLIAEGLLFERIYSSGDRTDKGVVAVLNAFPSQAIRSIMKLNSKQEKLPSLGKTLVANGYQSAFFYGGESEFFNMKSYLLSHAYQSITDVKSFAKKDRNSKWGAFDEVVYRKMLMESGSMRQPFFQTFLTLTHHEPFEVPGTPRFSGAEVENKFRSTAFYADSCLGAYIQNAKKEPWYKNTLFIVVADHGHRLPKNESEIFHPNRFRIPLLFLGGALKQENHGKRIGTIGSQTDIASTLFSQMNIPHPEFRWSRNLLAPNSQDFAFFNWDNGFGIVTDQQVLSYDNVGKKVLFRSEAHGADEARLVRWGKACMQQVYQDYLDF